VASATVEEIRGLLGDTDELVIERIEETGASTGEIAEALKARADEEQLDPSSSRVAEVIAILDRYHADDDDLDEQPYVYDGAEDHT
jgi:hypothetical protein